MRNKWDKRKGPVPSDWDTAWVYLQGEDECLTSDPDAWRVEAAYLALTDQVLKHQKAVATQDGGDCLTYLMDTGFVIEDLYDGTSILGVLPLAGA